MTTRRADVPLLLTLVFGVLGASLASEIAFASHVRPLSATPIRVPLVPAYKQCTAPNSNHHAPLSFPSCRPPVQASSFLTVGTPDANGAGVGSTGFMRFDVHHVATEPPQDLVISSTITDVRCKAGVTPSLCGNANDADGADYSGELQGDAKIRISDHQNGPNQNEAGTVIDIPFPISMQCASTADTSVGGTCNVSSSFVAVIGAPEPAEPARTVVGITQIQVFDGGPDGFASSQDNTLFMTQGVFVP